MSCEFSQVTNDNQGVACKTTVALPELKVQLSQQLGIPNLTIKDVKELVCDSCDQSDCRAHQELKARGRGSRFCK